MQLRGSVRYKLARMLGGGVMYVCVRRPVWRRNVRRQSPVSAPLTSIASPSPMMPSEA